MISEPVLIIINNNINKDRGFLCGGKVVGIM